MNARSAYLCRPLPSIGDQCFHIPGFLRRVPSPLQGTSHRIRSNKSWYCLLAATRALVLEGKVVCSEGILIAGNIDASRFVTISAGEGRRADW